MRSIFQTFTETQATPAQIKEANQEYRARLAICQRLGVDAPSYERILAEIISSPAGALESRPLTREERRLGTVFQSYTQYQSPKTKE